jgi:hypothetical protein
MSDAVTSLPAGQPEHTLGWDVLAWTGDYVLQPDGPDAGGPWRFTREQVLFVLWWYAIDKRGRWLYTRGVLRRAKGWGKTPVVGALALAELCGPVRFGGWDAAGKPVAIPTSAAWVQLSGVSLPQTTNTMSMVLAMASESPIVDDYGLDLGLTRIFTRAGGRLEPITAAAATAEGARPTFLVEDETHHWTESNNGLDLDKTNRRNLGKSRDGAARMLETTNAHASGSGSVAEKSYEAWQAIDEGRSRSTGLLYDAREAPAGVDLADEDQLTEGLEAAYGDSAWVDLERIRDEVWDPATPPEDSRRFYLNQIASATDAWLTEWEWLPRADVTRIVADREMITLGFDGSRRRARGVTDATALIACRVSDGHLFEPLEHSVWEQPANWPRDRDWTVPVGEVDAAVQAVFRTYNVVGFFADPAKWETYVASWTARYAKRLQVKATQAHPIEWWFTGGRSHLIVRALEQFHDAVLDEELTFDGSHALTRHVLNARRRPTRSGLQISKEHPDSPLKIDAAIAAVLAWQARLEAIARGVSATETFVPRRIR